MEDQNQARWKKLVADLLVRVQSHSAARIDELLPHIWRPPTPGPST